VVHDEFEVKENKGMMHICEINDCCGWYVYHMVMLYDMLKMLQNIQNMLVSLYCVCVCVCVCVYI